MTLYRIVEAYGQEGQYRVETVDHNQNICYVRPADRATDTLVHDQINELVPLVPMFHAVQLTGQIWLKVLPGGYQLFQTYGE